MNNTQRRKTFRTRLRNAWNRVKRPFVKTVVLVSTVAALSACGDKSILPAKDSGLYRDQIVRLDSGVDSFSAPDKTPTPDSLVEDKCKTGELKCSPYADCVDNACITKKQFTDLCKPNQNTIPLGPTPVSMNGLNLTYQGANLKEGQCIQFTSDNHDYTIYRDTHNIDYEINLIIFDENRRDFSSKLGDFKYLRFGDGLSLFYGEVQGEPSWIYLHKIIPVDAVEVKLDGCDAVGDPTMRAKFIQNTKKFLKAIESATGINIGECLQTLRYVLDPAAQCCAYANTWGEQGIIVISKAMLEGAITSPINLEWHEPIHPLRSCTNIYRMLDNRHIFWEATTEQILREYGDSALADKNAFWLKNIVDSIDKDPSIIDTTQGDLGGCPGMASYLLSKEYLKQTPQGKRDLVRKFHMSVRDDPDSLLNYPIDRKAIIHIVCNLVSDPSCLTKINKYCLP